METKFWTLQKKIYLIAVTVVAVGGVWALIIAGTNQVKISIDNRITVRAERVADSCDSIVCARRSPIDSMILAKLDRITMDNMRSRYFQEESMTPAEYSKARSIWVRDSIRWAKDK